MYAGSSSVGNVAWYIDNSDSHVHEVGKKAATGAGLYDMSGNVYEWCVDQFGNYSYTNSLTPVNGKNLVSSDISNNGATSGASLRNPIGWLNSAYTRTVRSGSWYYSAEVSSLGQRYDYEPSRASGFVGFRSVGCP
jgi:formylglycine-generating enzyme required for sulfatase activity